jgi:hypothetical protein
MGSASFQPKWWTEKHGSTWENVKDALKRDWEQTKSDLHLGGRDLDQGVGDTLKQATGAETAPVSNSRGTAKGSDYGWDYAEQPLMYGVGAREQYGAQHAQWNDNLESTLRDDWDRDNTGTSGGVRRTWDDVKSVVRHGFERARR